MPKQVIVYPPDWWIRARRADKASVLLLPMKLPVDDMSTVTDVQYRADGYVEYKDRGIVRYDGCRFAPGDTLLCREAWNWYWDGECEHCAVKRYEYRADYPGDGAKWRSPIHMPAEAVRIKPTVFSVSAVWMPDVSEEDAERAGVLQNEAWYRDDSECNDASATRALYYAWRKRYHTWKMWAWKLELNPQPATDMPL